MMSCSLVTVLRSGRVVSDLTGGGGAGQGHFCFMWGEEQLLHRELPKQCAFHLQVECFCHITFGEMHDVIYGLVVTR
jgi:hypothetical protein